MKKHLTEYEKYAVREGRKHLYKNILRKAEGVYEVSLPELSYFETIAAGLGRKRILGGERYGWSVREVYEENLKISTLQIITLQPVTVWERHKEIKDRAERGVFVVWILLCCVMPYVVFVPGWWGVKIACCVVFLGVLAWAHWEAEEERVVSAASELVTEEMIAMYMRSDECEEVARGSLDSYKEDGNPLWRAVEEWLEWKEEMNNKHGRLRLKRR